MSTQIPIIRISRRLASAFAVGCVVSILIAMLLALYWDPLSWSGTPAVGMDDSMPARVGDPSLPRNAIMLLRPVAPDYVWITRTLSRLPNSGLDTLHAYYQLPETDPVAIALWDPDSGDPVPMIQITRDRFGWPLRTLSREQAHAGHVENAASIAAVGDLNNPNSYRWGIRWPWGKGRFGKAKTLPIAIMWGGLITNAVLWGFVWMLLVGIYSVWRSSRRRKRGLCARCGYQLEDQNACPECGTSNARSRSRNRTASDLV